MQRVRQERTADRAQASSHTVVSALALVPAYPVAAALSRQRERFAPARVAGAFLMHLPAMPADAGASADAGGAGGVHQKGLSLLVIETFSFAPPRPVHQPVQRLIFPIGTHPMEQLEMPLLQRLEGPDVVPAGLLRRCRTYREAVRLCWTLRRVRGLRAVDAARLAGLTRQHVTDYLHADDRRTRRDLPAERIKDFEDLCGNACITQWLAARQALTVLEQLQAERLAA